MAGSTFQPPINLDPNQDPSQQTAFINQNFQSLAAALETNSFRIVKVGTGVATAPSVTATAGNWSTDSSTTIVSHKLGYTPVVLAYLDFSVAQDGSDLVQLPFTNFGGTYTNSSSFLTQFWWISVDSTNLYVYGQSTVYGRTLPAVSGLAFKYYLLQQTS